MESRQARAHPDGDLLTYEWEFGHGTLPVPGPTASNTYSAAGTYFVRLEVRDGTGWAVETTILATITEATVFQNFH